MEMIAERVAARRLASRPDSMVHVRAMLTQWSALRAQHRSLQTGLSSCQLATYVEQCPSPPSAPPASVDLQAETGVDFLRGDVGNKLQDGLNQMTESFMNGNPTVAVSTSFAKDLIETRGYGSRRKKLQALFSLALGMRRLTCLRKPGQNPGPPGARKCAAQTKRMQIDPAQLGLTSAFSDSRLRGKSVMRLESLDDDEDEHSREVAVNDVDEGVMFVVNRTRSDQNGCGTVEFGSNVTGVPVHCLSLIHI